MVIRTHRGEIVAIADGTAVITATSSFNKEVSASCTVTVGHSDPVAPKAFVCRIERVADFRKSISEDGRYDQDTTFSFGYDNTDRAISYAVDIRPSIPTTNPTAWSALSTAHHPTTSQSGISGLTRAARATTPDSMRRALLPNASRAPMHTTPLPASTAPSSWNTTLKIEFLRC